MIHNEQFAERLKTWRHQIHAHPEAAFEETETARFVADKLEEFGFEVVRGVGGTGVVATLRCGNAERVIGLRADMDCICDTEKGVHPYTSQVPKRMHACGHDGHTTALLGAAELLSKNRDFNGTVRLIFQPAEEPGKGALAMMADGLLERFPMDEMYSLHNWPTFPAGTIHMRTGGMMASEDNFEIVIKGQGGHASSPHGTIDPLIPAAQIILGLQTIVSRNQNPANPSVISITEMLTDGIHNTIPSTVRLLGDTRSTTPEAQELIERRMEEICRGICQAFNAECVFSYTHEFVPLVNDETCTAIAAQAAKKVVGEENVDTNTMPIMASEDFAQFLSKVPGCYVFVGGNRCDGTPVYTCHNPNFDFNDNTLELCAWYFYEVARTRLN